MIRSVFVSMSFSCGSPDSVECQWARYPVLAGARQARNLLILTLERYHRSYADSPADLARLKKSDVKPSCLSGHWCDLSGITFCINAARHAIWFASKLTRQCATSLVNDLIAREVHGGAGHGTRSIRCD